MHAVLRFSTQLFDVTKERRNDINPIYGESLLIWLAEQARNTVAIPPPSTEDWGWYSEIDWKGRSYLLGASASLEQSGTTEWVLQIVKHRSLRERLLGKEKMTPDDACLTFFRQLIEHETRFSNLTVE